jgi:exosortase family protein XrtF
LKELIKKYRTVIRFVLLFLGVYLLLSLLYGLYLKLSQGGDYIPDLVTYLVANQSSAVISGFDYNATIVPHTTDPTMKLIINGDYVARIIEGCNSLSIIILFIAFVVAFAENFKKTLLFVLAGSVLIYAMNIARIVILAIALYHFPEYEKVLHGVVFPGLIYGMVFLLWILWVRMLKNHKTSSL